MTRISGTLTAASVSHGLIASIHANALNIYRYDGDELSLTQRIPLDSELCARVKLIRFSPRHSSLSHKSSATSPNGNNEDDDAEARVLLATDTSIHVFSSVDPTWHASLANANAPSGRIAHCAFVGGPSEVLVAADFGAKTTIWNLDRAQGTEIAAPKARLGTAAYSVRPVSGHVAILTRAGGKDTVAILGPGTETRRLEASMVLDSSDAAGIKWSPDGRWLVAWENAALGPAVWIYTADGQLFRKWTGASPNHKKANSVQMGLKNVEWDATGNWLLLGTGDGSIVGLRSRKFTPHFSLGHPSHISVPASASIWQEQIATTGSTREYAIAQQPAIPPSGASGPISTSTSASATSTSAPTSTTPAPATGITHLAPAPSGSLLASVSANTPTTVWIHSLPFNDERQAPLTRAVLIHHHAVKTLEWNAEGTRLLIHCSLPSSSSSSSSISTSTSHPSAAVGTAAAAITHPADGGHEDTTQAPAYWAHIYSDFYSSSLSSLTSSSIGLGKSITSPTHVEILPISVSGSSQNSSETSSKYTLSWAGTMHGSEAVLLSTSVGGIGATLTPTPTPAQLAQGYGPGWNGIRITGTGPEDAFDEDTHGHGHDYGNDHEERTNSDILKKRIVEDDDEGENDNTQQQAVADDTFAFRRGWGTKVG